MSVKGKQFKYNNNVYTNTYINIPTFCYGFTKIKLNYQSSCSICCESY